MDSIQVLADLVPIPMTIDWQSVERSLPPNTFPIVIRTPALAGATGAVIPCQVIRPAPGARLWIRVRAQVMAGEASIGLLSDSDGSVRQRVVKSAEDGEQTIMLEVDATTEPVRLAIQNGSRAQPAQLVIEAIDARSLP